MLAEAPDDQDDHDDQEETALMQDRIRELRRVPAAELVAHPKNWRRHPQRQATALRAALEQIGFADALLVRELEDGQLQIIDGHLRAEVSGDQRVPVLILDVSAEEAEALLATHDPLTGMAEADQQKLAELLADVQTSTPRLEQLLDTIGQDIGLAPPQASKTTDCEIPDCYQIVVECEGEAEQQQLFDQLTAEGYKCRVLTM